MIPRHGDNRSISRRASDSPARGRAGHGAISGASQGSSNYDNRSFVRPSFVRSLVRVLLLTTLGEKTRNLTQVPSLALNDLGPGSNLPPVALDLGFLFFFPFFFCHLPPSRPTQPLGTWVKFTHSPSPFCSPPSISTQPPSLHSHPSLVPISFVYMLYSFFWAKNSGLDKLAILTYPSQCFVLEKFCSFF